MEVWSASQPVRFKPGITASITQWVGGRVGPRAGLYLPYDISHVSLEVPEGDGTYADRNQFMLRF
jgi:hypothetical protein